jgi:hypothetical protein
VPFRGVRGPELLPVGPTSGGTWVVGTRLLPLRRPLSPRRR